MVKKKKLLHGKNFIYHPLLLIICVVALLSLMTVLGYIVFSISGSNPYKNMKEKIYRDERNGYSLMYPSGFKIFVRSKDYGFPGTEIDFPDKSGQDSIVIMKWPVSELYDNPIDAIKINIGAAGGAEDFSGIKKWDVQTKPIIIGGYQGIYIDHTLGASYGTIASVQKGNDIYIFELSSVPEDSTHYNPHNIPPEDERSVFFHIISTFKFTN